MNRILYILLLSTLLLSCKKTKLNGDMEKLIGEWEWKVSIRIGNTCDPMGGGQKDTILSSGSVTYRLKFYQKGKLETYKNDKKEKTYRLVLDSNPIPTRFTFLLNNRKKKAISIDYVVFSGIEQIHTNDFPLGTLKAPDGCYYEYSVFEKVN